MWLFLITPYLPHKFFKLLFIPVAIYLVNGIKLQGHVESFDQFVVLLGSTVSQLVYKHAISTIVPARPIKLTIEDDE